MFRDSRYQLATTVCLLLLIGFLTSSISSYYVSRNNVRHTIMDSSLPLTSDNIYSVIQRDLLQPIFISSMMANDAFLRDWVLGGEENLEQMQRFLSEIRREYGTVTSFFVSESTRSYYYWGGILKRVAEETPADAWYFRVRKMEAPFEINVDPDMANRNTMTVFVNYRVHDFEGNYIGATGAGLTVNHVNELIEEYEARFGRAIFFVDQSGKLMVGPHHTALSAYDNLREFPGLKAHADALLKEGLESLVYDRDGQTFFLNSRFVPELNWFLIVEQTEHQLLEPLRETLLLNIGLALVITVVVAFICTSAIHHHQRRLERRNLELSLAKTEVEQQKAELERGARELESVNRSLFALNREKDDFLEIVAHDLRNPLNGVLGVCEEIRLGIPPDQEELHEDLADIRRSGFEMLDLIDDILNVSSIESFQGPLELEPFNWNQLAREVCLRFRSQAGIKKIRLEVLLDPNAETDVPTQARWLAICLNNLVSNALKYSPPKSRVTIETARLNDATFELRVRDEGPGIRPEEVGALFIKFQRLSSRPTGGEPSSGLGLYIVQKMCLRLGATVFLDRAVTTGSCFVIRHPYNSAG